jgi:predicted nucleotidyltransferase
MKFEVSKLNNWQLAKEGQLPGLTELFNNIASKILIIGAAVFELYELQGWMPPLKRKTGDIDLSVGIVGTDSNYQFAKTVLLKHKYQQDEHFPYRFHPAQKILGGYSYIDLLAHPANIQTKSIIAQNAMGIGTGFSFTGYTFAQMESFQLTSKVIFPNPFGLITLKMISYLDDPVKRVKDFADIIELINGLVETATHFEMGDLWNKISSQPESQKIKTMISKTTSIESLGNWDIDNIRSELIKRSFDSDFVDTTLIQRLTDFHELLA